MNILNLVKYRTDLANFIYRLVQIVFRQGILFCFTLIAAKVLTPDIFSKISYLMAMVIFFSTIAETGFSFSMSKFVAEDDLKGKRHSTTLATALISLFVFFLILTSIFLISSHIFLSDDLRPYTYLLAPLIYLVPAVSIFDGLFRGLRDFRSLTIINIVSGGLSMMAFFPLIQSLGDKGLILSYLFLYGTCLLFSFIWYQYYSGKDNGEFIFDKDIAKTISLYSFQLGIASLGYFLFSRFSILLLGTFGYVKETALYELILKFEAILLLPSFILGHILAPKMTILYRTNKVVFFDSFKKAYLLSLVYGLLVSLAYFCFLFFIFKGPYREYSIDSVGIILLISSLTFFIKSYSSIIDFGFIISSGYGRLTARLYPVIGAVNALLGILLIKRIGGVGSVALVFVAHAAMIVILHPLIYIKLQRETLKAQ